MTTDLTAITGSDYTLEDIKLMKETICKGSTDADFKLFIMICKRTKLDPFAKQIYAVFRFDKKLNRQVMTVQTSIDGLRLVAERTGKYSPGKESSYAYDDQNKIKYATAYVKKMTPDGLWHESGATAYFEEYVQKTSDGRLTQFWLKMPHIMIAKCAEALALRRAFPMELSGLYTSDEMAQSKEESDVSMMEADVSIVEQTKPVQIDEITSTQAHELLRLRACLIEDDRNIIDDWVKKTYNIQSLDQLPSSQFEKILNSLINKVNTGKNENSKN